MRALPEEKRLNAIALLQHGHSTREVSKMLGISQSTCSRICRVCVPYVEPSRGGHSRSTTLAQHRACVKTITVGGLDYDVDMRNGLTKHLNVVVSINTIKRALHEVGLGSLEKLKHILLTPKNVQCRLEFAHPQD
jgi:transposase